MNTSVRQVTCKQCLTSFILSAGVRYFGRTRFCSTACHVRWQTEYLRKRFISNLTHPNANGCINWGGDTMKSGYGYIQSTTCADDRKMVYAHRLAYEYAYGPILNGLFVCHKCDNPSCVNPIHLFLGTNLDNFRDSQSKGRRAVGSRSGHAKLTSDDVLTIRKLYSLGNTTQYELALSYGVDQSTVSGIISRKRWRHIA